MLINNLKKVGRGEYIFLPKPISQVCAARTASTLQFCGTQQSVGEYSVMSVPPHFQHCSSPWSRPARQLGLAQKRCVITLTSGSDMILPPVCFDTFKCRLVKSVSEKMNYLKTTLMGGSLLKSI